MATNRNSGAVDVIDSVIRTLTEDGESVTVPPAGSTYFLEDTFSFRHILSNLTQHHLSIVLLTYLSVLLFLLRVPPVVTGGTLIVFMVVVLVDNPLCFFVAWCGGKEELFGFVKHDADVVGDAVVAQVSLVEVGVDGLDELENVGVIPHGFVESAGSAFSFRCSVSLVVEGFQFIRQFAVTVSTGEGASVEELGIFDGNSHRRDVVVG